ncbi:MAG: heparinase II/III-family protein [Planctomycetaceae bacterium]|nr:heparinase II/III-family protein [Planctomycetaceae bacterium]
MNKTFRMLLVTLWFLSYLIPLVAAERYAVPKEHPRLFGNADALTMLAEQRPQDFQRTQSVANNPESGEYARMVSISLVNAVEPDAALARQAVELAMKRINDPIVTGHAPFGSVLAECAIVYDYCYDQWTPEERAKFIDYFNRTVAANVNEETHVFHNGWYGYKNWGYGIAAYATYYENPDSPKLLAALEREYVARAAPALELSGDGGGFAEGYYVNYWIYQWTVFCNVAYRCEGVDYFALAPNFFENRAVAGMFEMYPGIGEYGSRRPIPMGDGGGRRFGGDRDNTLNARRILTGYYRNDPAHQAVYAFDESTPRVSVGDYAYKDFLWRDITIPKGDLAKFKLSHYSPGPGYAYARSSWDEDATYFFFKCGNRFTAHQHLDVGTFLIYKEGELIGDGGHYDGFGTPHDVNYHLRTIAHNTIRVIDPEESWDVKGRDPIRAGNVTSNDGGQRYDWPQHNGAVSDAAQWNVQKEIWETGTILAFEELGDHVIIKADCTKAYSPEKLELFIRQIVFLRPGTIIIVDSVRVKDPAFKTIWNLQAMKQPTKVTDNKGNDLGLWTWSNGNGRLFLQTLLPEKTDVELFTGEKLYTINGINYPPQNDTGPAPECRMEISPTDAKKDHLFVHVLSVTEDGVHQVPLAKASHLEHKIKVELDAEHSFEFDIGLK